MKEPIVTSRCGEPKASELLSKRSLKIDDVLVIYFIPGLLYEMFL